MATIASLFLLSGCSSARSHGNQPPIPNEPLTYQVFYDRLSPYGVWIEYPQYGQVWSPGISEDFRPYVTNGYWVATEDGWAWTSNYKWGWAPFHYGRWFFDTRFGWLWLPGYEWAPAWVVWGTTEDYYCWAPLMPEVDVTIMFDSWSPALFYWNLCPRRHFTGTRLQPIVVRGDRAVTGTRITRIRNYSQTAQRRLYYNQGPAFEDVRRETGGLVRPIRVEDATRAPNRVSSDKVRIYRPRIEQPSQRGTPPAPRRYKSDDAVEPSTMPHGEMIESQKVQRANVNRLPERRESGRR